MAKSNAGKRKVNEGLRWVGIAALAYFGFNMLYNAVYNRVGFGKPRIRLSNPTLTSVRAEITFPIENNNPVAFPLEGLIAQVVYGPYILATLVQSQPVEIKANDTTLLVFNTRLDYANLGGSIMALVESGEFLQTLRIRGEAISSGLKIPFDNPISVG